MEGQGQMTCCLCSQGLESPSYFNGKNKSDPVLVKGCVDNFYLLNSSGSFVPDAPYFVLEDPNLAIQRRQWHPTPVLLPGKSHGQRSLMGHSPWCCKVRHD